MLERRYHAAPHILPAGEDLAHISRTSDSQQQIRKGSFVLFCLSFISYQSNSQFILWLFVTVLNDPTDILQVGGIILDSSISGSLYVRAEA